MSNARGALPDRSELIDACRQLYTSIDDFDQMVAEIAGITKSDLRALNKLERGPVQAGELAKSLGMTTGAITTLIDRLEKKKLVRRTRDANDRRVVLVQPTPKLFEQIGSIYRKMADSLAWQSNDMSSKELSECIRSLQFVSRVYVETIETVKSSAMDG